MVADTQDLAMDTDLLTPIDDIETFVMTTSWRYERLSSHELVINFKGHYCEYQATIVWIEHTNILHLAMSFSVGLSKEPMTSTKEHTLLKLLSLMNESLQLGHFDLWREENAIVWRYGQLLSDSALSHDTLSYLFRTAIDTCERHYPAFQFVLWAGHSPADAMQFVLFETAGEA
ncbi:MAG: hypothetical protein ACJARD_000491 [Alphaproteobacteria bacterium]|jgi:hypothetical protein